MQFPSQGKPISQLKAHAAEILLDLAQSREQRVTISLIADGRRELQTLLENRLLLR